MTSLRSPAVVLLSLLLAACGSDAGGTGPGGGSGEEPTVTTVTVTPDEVTLEVDETVALEADVLDQDGNAMSASVSWASSDSDVADVNAEGVVTGRAAGEAVIAATAEGVTGTADVTVEEALSPLERTLEEARDVHREVIPDPSAPAEQRNPLEELEAMAEGLVELDGILAVRTNTDALTLQAVTTEGIPLLFINNRFDIASGDPGSSGLAAPSAEWRSAGTAPHPGSHADAVSAPRAAGPPGTRNAVVWEWEGGAAEAEEIESLLFSAGYNVRMGLDEPSDLRAAPYDDLGALMIDTHGAAFNVMEVTTDENGDPDVEHTGNHRYALLTGAQTQDQFSETTYEDIERGDLVLAMTGNESEWYLGITDSFIRRYWTFDGGVAMTHSCHSGADRYTPKGDCFGSPLSFCDTDITVDPTVLRQALLEVGADLVVAFDPITSTLKAQPSRMYFFDRMLGTDRYGDPDPPARPFPAEDVVQGMADQGLTQFSFPAWTAVTEGYSPLDETTVIFDGDLEGAQLAPTIRTMEVVDDAARDAGELTLLGGFGSDRGTVTIDDTEVSVTEWDAERIVAEVPFEGTASSGDVVVRSDAEIPSNEAPLTKWTGRMEVTLDPGSGDLSATSVVDLVVRADVHGYRTTLPDDPSRPETTTYVSPASEGQTDGQGAVVTQDGSTEWYGTTETRILTKEEVDAAAAGTAGYDEGVFGGLLTLRPEVNEAELCFFWQGMVNVRDTSQGEFQIELPLGFPELLGQGRLTCLDMTLTDDYTIQGGARRWAPDDEFELELVWSDLQPTSPPFSWTAG